MRIHIDIDSPTKLISIHTEKCHHTKGWEKIRDQKVENRTGTRMMVESVEELQKIKKEYCEKGYAINIHSKCIGEAILSL